MPRICAIAVCENIEGKNELISFHKFPKDDKLKSIWINKCFRKDLYLNPNKDKVCSEHFRPEDIENYVQEQLLPSIRTVLKKDAVPILKLRHTNPL